MSVCRHIILNVKLFLLSFFSCRVSESTRTWAIDAVGLFFMMSLAPCLVPCLAPKKSPRNPWSCSQENKKKSILSPCLRFLTCSLPFAVQCLQTQKYAVVTGSSHPMPAQRGLPHGCDKALPTQFSAPGLLSVPVPASAAWPKSSPRGGCSTCTLIAWKRGVKHLETQADPFILIVKMPPGNNWAIQ